MTYILSQKCCAILAENLFQWRGELLELRAPFFLCKGVYECSALLELINWMFLKLSSWFFDQYCIVSGVPAVRNAYTKIMSASDNFVLHTMHNGISVKTRNLLFIVNIPTAQWILSAPLDIRFLIANNCKNRRGIFKGLSQNGERQILLKISTYVFL